MHAHALLVSNAHLMWLRIMVTTAGWRRVAAAPKVLPLAYIIKEHSLQSPSFSRLLATVNKLIPEAWAKIDPQGACVIPLTAREQEPCLSDVGERVSSDAELGRALWRFLDLASRVPESEQHFELCFVNAEEWVTADGTLNGFEALRAEIAKGPR